MGDEWLGKHGDTIPTSGILPKLPKQAIFKGGEPKDVIKLGGKTGEYFTLFDAFAFLLCMLFHFNCPCTIGLTMFL